METISSNHFSHDQQVQDVMEYLEHHDGIAYSHLVNMFPEFTVALFDGSSYDTYSMDVDADWSSWLTDEIEACSNIMWMDGEPFTVEDADYDMDVDDFFGFSVIDSDGTYSELAS
tara:strand:+ start:122 stop:466 length:345 start_codon:yes stop_codon:yes gene_type:complete